MVGQLVLAVALIGSDDAGGARVASRGAIGFDFNAMGEAFWDVPSGGRDSADRTGGHAGADSAPRTWVERFGRGGIEISIEQKGGAERDPGTVSWIDHDPEQAWAGESGGN